MRSIGFPPEGYWRAHWITLGFATQCSRMCALFLRLGGEQQRISLAAAGLRIGFLNHLFMAGAIAQDRESCQFPFVLDEKPTVVSVGSAGERSGGAQEVPYGAARSIS